MSIWSVGLWWNNVTNNTVQLGRLQLERAAAGASARAENSTVAGALLYFGVCWGLVFFLAEFGVFGGVPGVSSHCALLSVFFAQRPKC